MTRPSRGGVYHWVAEHGTSRGLVVCADIDPSADNNAYVAGHVRENPEALSYAIDVD